MTLTATRIQIAQITSGPTPQEGQKNRSSGDFSTEGVPGGFSKFYWEVSGVSVPAGVMFNVMEDKSAAIDPVIWSDLTDGSVTEIKKFRQIYIANPRGASGNFVVTVYATN